MTPHNDEKFDLSGLDMEQVVIDISGNTMLSADEDGSVCDADIFILLPPFKTFKLIPRFPCVLKINICQVDVENAFLNRCLKV